jgi:hypothetical protein
VCFARGWLFAGDLNYTLLRNPRMATPFNSFAEADASAQEALAELKFLKEGEQYYMISQPAVG